MSTKTDDKENGPGGGRSAQRPGGGWSASKFVHLSTKLINRWDRFRKNVKRMLIAFTIETYNISARDQPGRSVEH